MVGPSGLQLKWRLSWRATLVIILIPGLSLKSKPWLCDASNLLQRKERLLIEKELVVFLFPHLSLPPLLLPIGRVNGGDWLFMSVGLQLSCIYNILLDPTIF